MRASGSASFSLGRRSPSSRRPSTEGFRRYAERVLHYGYAESFADYAALLWRSDLVVSTSVHEFFGISMLEAIYCGCHPLLPNRLTYPELIPEQPAPAAPPRAGPLRERGGPVRDAPRDPARRAGAAPRRGPPPDPRRPRVAAPGIALRRPLRGGGGWMWRVGRRAAPTLRGDGPPARPGRR